MLMLTAESSHAHTSAHYQPHCLRPYQQAAVQAITSAWQKGLTAPLAALATGGGKTTIACDLAVSHIDPATQRILVIAHTGELIRQFADRLRNQFNGRLDCMFVEPGQMFVPGLGLIDQHTKDHNARVVVATRQSLHEKSIKKLLTHGAIDLLIIDEAHHATLDNTYGAIVDVLKHKNPDLKILGLTATPKRTDKKALGTIFDDIVYTWLIPDGIDNGHLSPVTRIKVFTDVQLSDVKNTAGDYNKKRLISVLKTANWLDLAVDAFLKHIGQKRPTLAFLPAVDMSRDFAQQLRTHGIKAAHLDGTTEKTARRQTLADYAQGKLQVISNMSVLTEGYDAPRTSAIFLARPTRSPVLFTQILGRGLRPFPGKSDCLLVDLSPEDTKALQQGTLMGKMVTCAQCKIDFVSGSDRCPHCGTPTPQKLTDTSSLKGVSPFPDKKPVGQDLLNIKTSIFDDAFAAWYIDSDGFLSCARSEQATFVIVPPLGDGQYPTCYHLLDVERNKTIKNITRNEDLASLLADAEGHLDRTNANLTDKSKSWRSRPASQRQIQFLDSLGAMFSDDISKGKAAQLITHYLAIRTVHKALRI
jgi:superfamily II DNA or RNA helicase